MATVQLTDRHRSMIFLNIIVTATASGMMATSLVTALPAIMRDLNVNAGVGQWLTSGYSLTMAIVMPLTAHLTKTIRTKRLYTSAALLFVLGLLICALSSSFIGVLIGRLIQACGAAVLTPIGQLILLSIYPRERSGRVMGWYGMAIGLSPVISPVIAGLIIDSIGWKMIFWLVLAIMMVSVIMSVIYFRDVLDTAPRKFDMPSLILSAFAFGGITLAAGNLGNAPILSLSIAGMLVVAIITGFLLVRRQGHIEPPFLDFSMLPKYPVLALAIFTCFLANSIMMGTSVLLPLLVQTALGYSATVFGLMALPGGIIMALLSPMIGKVFDEYGIRPILIAGGVLMLISDVVYIFCTVSTSLLFLGIFNIFRMVGMGCVMMPPVTWGLNTVPDQLKPDASAVLQSFRSLATALGIALFAAIATMMASFSGLTGAEAMMYGLSKGYLVTAGLDIVLICIGLFGAKSSKQ